MSNASVDLLVRIAAQENDGQGVHATGSYERPHSLWFLAWDCCGICGTVTVADGDVDELARLGWLVGVIVEETVVSLCPERRVVDVDVEHPTKPAMGNTTLARTQVRFIVKSRSCGEATCWNAESC